MKFLKYVVSQLYRILNDLTNSIELYLVFIFILRLYYSFQCDIALILHLE